MLDTIENLKCFMTVLEDFQDGALLCDTEMKILHANQLAHYIFAYEPDELINSNISRLIPVHVRSKHTELANGYLKNPTPRTMNMMAHLTGLKKDGCEIHISISLKPVFLSGEQLTLVTVRNVEHTVRLEAQVFHTQKMEAIGKTCSSIIHDLKNILQIISASSFLAGDSNEDTPALLNDINNQTELASNMLSYLLTYLKEGAPKPGCVDLNALLNNFHPIACSALPKQTTINFNIEDGSHEIYSTPTAISQLLLNLLVNAADALQETEQPALQINLYTLANDDICLTVSDNGCGMDEETQKNAFKAYFTTKNNKGTGLGLSTVYGIILDLGGHIEIFSRASQGTTFIMKMPRYTPIHRR